MLDPLCLHNVCERPSSGGELGHQPVGKSYLASGNQIFQNYFSPWGSFLFHNICLYFQRYSYSPFSNKRGGIIHLLLLRHFRYLPYFIICSFIVILDPKQPYNFFGKIVLPTPLLRLNNLLFIRDAKVDRYAVKILI